MSAGTILSEYWWVCLLAIAALLVPGYLLLLFVVALRETQYACMLLPHSADEPETTDDYVLAMAQQAQEHGFGPVGSARSPNSAAARVHVHVMLSPDRRTAALICGGRIAGMRARKTMLISQQGVGRTLATCDEVDMSGFDVRMVLNADFAELWAVHQASLAEAGRPAQPYAQDVLRDLDRQKSDQVHKLFLQGDARPLDVPGHTWRYTVKGALKLATVQFFRQLSLAVPQLDRHGIARPGS